MDQSLSYKHCQQNNRKRGLNVAITRNTLTRHLATRAGKCDDTHQHCSNTNGCFYPRKPVASKQSTCVESEREVNKVNGRLTETVKGQCRSGHPPATRRPSTALRRTEATRSVLSASGGLRKVGRAAQPASSVSSAMKTSSASTRSISRRGATLIQLAVSTPSNSRMSFVDSTARSRTSWNPLSG